MESRRSHTISNEQGSYIGLHMQCLTGLEDISRLYKGEDEDSKVGGYGDSPSNHRYYGECSAETTMQVTFDSMNTHD